MSSRLALAWLEAFICCNHASARTVSRERKRFVGSFGVPNKTFCLQGARTKLPSKHSLLGCNPTKTLFVVLQPEQNSRTRHSPICDPGNPRTKTQTKTKRSRTQTPNKTKRARTPERSLRRSLYETNAVMECRNPTPIPLRNSNCQGWLEYFDLSV